MIRGEGISFGYDAAPRVLEDVQVRADAGRMTALTGPSGRGKSTLLFILGLLLQPQEGALHLDGVNTSTLSDAGRSRLRAGVIGFVFQDAALDASRSILENVIESCDYTGASRAKAGPRAAALLAEMGVDIPPTRRPLQISGGQAQRVALCRALLPEPQIILADEPTGNLDGASSAAVLHRLRAEADRGRTVVIATHDPRVLDQCDSRVDL
jgi:ABC-type lipoprotein export system ATPase subunit